MNTIDRRLLFVCALLLGFLGAVRPGHAGPWSKSPGKFYVKLSENLIWSSESNHPFFAASTAVYGEVGIWGGLQAQVFLPFTIASLGRTNNPNEHYQVASFGDAIVGLQYTSPALMKATGFPIAFRLDFKLPLYDKFTADTPGLAENFTKFPLLGEGQLDITLWVSAGGSIPGTPLYAFGELGFRARTTAFFGKGYQELHDSSGLSFLHSLTLQSQLGFKAHKHLLIMLNLNGLLPLGTGLTGASNFGALPAGLRLNGSTDFTTKGFLALGVGLYIPVFKGLAVEASFDPLVFTINSDFALSVSFGLSYSY